jgi:hypothetical protein
MYTTLPTVFQKPDAARNENKSRRENSTTSEGARRSTRANLAMKVGDTVKKKRV